MKYENFRPSFMALAGHPRPQLVSTLSALCLNCPTNMRVRTILSAVVIADTIYYAMISVLAIILWFSKNHPLGGWNSLCLNYLEKNTTYEPRTGRGRFARPVCLVGGRSPIYRFRWTCFNIRWTCFNIRNVCTYVHHFRTKSLILNNFFRM